jgi:response regulator of citrate/malate metabolism
VIRVLVVDDDFMVARVHAGFVRRVPGFEVVGTAHTGAEALADVARLAPHLVLLDVYLPDMSGLDVLRTLRQECPDVDVLVVSAARDVDTVKEALRGGVVHYLVKPFDQAALAERLLAYAERHQGLGVLEEARQEDLDRLFGTTAAPTGRADLPKGLTPETADVVRRALVAAEDDLSSSECAEETGLSRVGARRYLEYFVATGRAEVRPRYGATGRPERRYRWKA